MGKWIFTDCSYTLCVKVFTLLFASVTVLALPEPSHVFYPQATLQLPFFIYEVKIKVLCFYFF